MLHPRPRRGLCTWPRGAGAGRGAPGCGHEIAAVAVAVAAVGLTALTVVVAVVVQIALGNLAPVVMPAVPITVALPVALGFGARAAWRKALGRNKELPAGTSQGWEAGDR